MKTAATGSKLRWQTATINGGTITLNGTIDVTGDSSINGTTTGGPSVTTDAILKNGVEIHCATMLATIMCLPGKSDRAG